MPRSTSQLRPTGSPAAATSADETRKGVQPHLLARGRQLVTVADDGQQPPQLLQGAPARLGDTRQCLGRLVRSRGQEVLGDAGLHHHHAHGVPKHVVELATDPQPFLDRGPVGALTFQVKLSAGRSHLSVVQRLALSHTGPEDPAHGQQGAVDRDSLEAEVDRSHESGRGEDGGDRTDRLVGGTNGSPGGHRVERDEHSDGGDRHDVAPAISPTRPAAQANSDASGRVRRMARGATAITVSTVDTRSDARLVSTPSTWDRCRATATTVQPRASSTSKVWVQRGPRRTPPTSEGLGRTVEAFTACPSWRSPDVPPDSTVGLRASRAHPAKDPGPEDEATPPQVEAADRRA